MYDAIVVVARCAGAPVAMLLARPGSQDPFRRPRDASSGIPHPYCIQRHETHIAEARFLKARLGMIDPHSFFNPENMHRLMTRGQVETT